MSNRSELAQRVADYIEQENLFESDSRLLVAVSGGLDSTVLVHLLIELGYRPQLAHYNYMLRGEESIEDVEFLKKLAESLCLELHIDGCTPEESESLKSDGNLQARARTMRYDFFERAAIATKCDHIVTAHHADDVLETFLINFLRGSGLKGLRSILPKNEVKVARPLLEISREALSLYAEENEIEWREDSTNASEDYLRNQLRHRVIPILHELKPGLSRTSSKTFEHLRSAYDLYMDSVNEGWNKLSQSDGRGWFTIDRQQLTGHLHKRMDTILVEILSAHHFNDEIRRQMREASPGSLLETTDRYILVSKKQIAIATKPIKQPKEAVTFTVGQELNLEIWLDHFTILKGELCDLNRKNHKPLKVRQAQIPHYLLYLPKRIALKVQVRRPRPGDRFKPFGMGGKTQKLQDYFVNEKIDRLERMHSWLLVDENDTILWVMGHRASEETRLEADEQDLIKLHFKRFHRGRFGIT